MSTVALCWVSRFTGSVSTVALAGFGLLARLPSTVIVRCGCVGFAVRGSLAMSAIYCLHRPVRMVTGSQGSNGFALRSRVSLSDVYRGNWTGASSAPEVLMGSTTRESSARICK